MFFEGTKGPLVGTLQQGLGVRVRCPWGLEMGWEQLMNFRGFLNFPKNDAGDALHGFVTSLYSLSSFQKFKLLPRTTC